LAAGPRTGTLGCCARRAARPARVGLQRGVERAAAACWAERLAG
jgi:hypothetical protein